jgi:YgiT-type zinc finger domain-containing protein
MDRFSQEESMMLCCHVCGSKEFREELVTEEFLIDGRTVIVEKIPAMVCIRCEEKVFLQRNG